MLSQEIGKQCEKSSAAFQCTRNIKGQWLVKWEYRADLAVLGCGENQLGWESKKLSQTSHLSDLLSDFDWVKFFCCCVFMTSFDSKNYVHACCLHDELSAS